MIEYRDLIIYTHPEVKEEIEASSLLIDILSIRMRDEVLLIGIGNGLLPVYAAKRSRKVIATDVNPHALSCGVKNTITNKTYNVELREGLFFEPVNDENFDLILFNAHYLLNLESIDETILYNSINRIGDYLKENGRFYILDSSQNSELLRTKLESAGLDAENIITEKCADEEIIVVKGNLKNG
ncbi:MAG: methyltransferase [Methanobacteriaceae archaeon]|nr:methyltransferase [Methanobacteriaceae archaeon]